MLLLTLLVALTGCRRSDVDVNVDICIYGGTSAGVIAAYTAAMQGKNVVLIEPGTHLGGMSSGGLGFTDIGNKFVVTGLARDFYRRVGQHYGALEQWVFEPHVAEEIFNQYIESGKVDVIYQRRIVSAETDGTRIVTATFENSADPEAVPTIKVQAKEWIDCSYEGDLMARAGVEYTVGREDNSLYGETYNGVQVMRGHQFWDPIDPYVVPGDSTSGLIWGVNPGPAATTGSGDSKVQAYNFRVCLTDDPDNIIPITRPDNYDSTRYELALRLHQVSPRKSAFDYFIWSAMPGRKTDINNGGPISSDMIGMNCDYPEADYARRAEIWKAHEDYTKGFFYFLGHDPRVPEEFRAQMLRWGYPKDEYTDNNGWTHQLYVREARRMVGRTVMTQAHCVGDIAVPDTIAWAAYTMDSHNCDRQIIDGRVQNEGNVEIGGFPPYPIGYGAIVPKSDQITNLIVPVCLSASHIAYGSIRMEPVFMVLAQAAAVAASMAIDNDCAVQDVEAAAIRAVIEADPLMDGTAPEIVVDNGTPSFTTTGRWDVAPDAWRAYGPDYLVCGSEGEAVYSPAIPAERPYTIYMYVPRTDSTPASITLTVAGKEVSLAPSDTPVIGQTYGEWLPLGTHTLAPGQPITLYGTPGTPADALLLIPA